MLALAYTPHRRLLNWSGVELVKCPSSALSACMELGKGVAVVVKICKWYKIIACRVLAYNVIGKGPYACCIL